MYIRVDMSKALHFAYTSHGKSLTITLLTYTLTRSKRNFFLLRRGKKTLVYPGKSLWTLALFIKY